MNVKAKVLTAGVFAAALAAFSLGFGCAPSSGFPDGLARLGVEAGPSRSARAALAAERATVVRVVDGDTLVVSVEGAEHKVRLIGVDAPESVSPDEARNCPEGALASDFAKSLLPAGEEVWLVADESDEDRYGRLLRYVWLDDPAEADAAESMANAVLVAEGYAQAKDYPPDTAFSALFHRLAGEAADAGKGVSALWAR